MKLSARLAGALMSMAGLSACDLPTGIPRWDTTWITPGEETSVSVAELLPPELGVNADTSAFVLAFDPVSESWQLRDFCPTCPPITATAPKPAFTTTLSTSMPLPADVRSIVLQGGQIDIELFNGFAFDPIRPGTNADSGSIAVTVRSGGAVVASLVIEGTQQSFSPGSTLVETLDFLPSTIADDLQIDFTLDSPAGDVTTLRPTDQLSLDISSTGVLVSEATVAVASQPISGTTTELDLSDVDIGDRFKEGTIFLEIDNDFTVTGNLQLTVDPGLKPGESIDPAPFTKTVALQSGVSEVAVTFTEAEIQQMVGAENTLTIGGVVNAIGGELTVRPDMAITVGTRLRVTVEVGGDSDDDSGF